MTTCPALTFRYHFHRHAKKKKKKDKNKKKWWHCQCVDHSSSLFWRSCTHSSERLKMLQCILKYSNASKMHFTLQQLVTLLLFELRMCGAMTLISSRNNVKETVTQLEKDKTALADQYTWVTPLPYLYKWLSQLLKTTGFSPFCRWCKFIL